MASKSISADLSSVTLEKAKTLLELFIKLKRPVFLHGPVGVGKSDLIAQIGKEQNRKVIDLRMSQMDISDLRGIPYFDGDNKTMKWGTPVCLPTDPNDTSILFLDEINCAQPSIQATAYQLILDRKVGEYNLPEGVSVVAAGNREKDRGTTFKMATPLLNRFVHVEVKYDFNAWKKWALKNDIHPSVVSYLSDHQTDLASFDPTNGNRAFATPRTWKYVSDCMHQLVVGGQKPDPSLLSIAIEACIGSAIEVKFSKWFNINGVVNVDDIISGKIKVMPNISDENTDFLIAFSHELGARLSQMNKAAKDDQSRTAMHKCINNSFTFMVNSSGKNRDIPMSFLTTLAQKYSITVNQEKSPAIEAYLKEPGVKKFLEQAALDKYNNSK